jgi:hypothetical protein
MGSDSSVYVNRGTLDFLNSHMPITTNFNTLGENISLAEGALYLIHKKDFACLKKFATWLLGHLDDEPDAPINFEKDNAVIALIPALKRIFEERP